MSYIALSMRVDKVDSYEEKRDAIDQRWLDFFLQAKLKALLLPNNLDLVKKITKEWKPSGIVLSGGNNLMKYGGDSPERDQVEYFLLELAIKENIPLIGVCRGMQILADYFSIKLIKVENEVYKKAACTAFGKKRLINSYHDWTLAQLSDDFNLEASTESGIIKAIQHKELPLLGIMWHPERLKPFSEEDLELFSKQLGVKNA